MSRVLVIPDLHEPCSRKGALAFCKDLQEEYQTDTTICVGDITDSHSVSFHASHPDMPGPKDEFELAFACLQKWYKEFPEATVCLGNHDRRVARLAESVKIPSHWIRGYSEVWETPNWKWVEEILLDDVLYSHGEGAGGSLYPAYNKLKNLGLSCVLGHFHSKSGVKWLVNPLRRMFGMDVGCLIDDKSMAFAYGKFATLRSVLSAGVVIDGIPHHRIMPCGRGEKYHDSNFVDPKKKPLVFVSPHVKPPKKRKILSPIHEGRITKEVARAAVKKVAGYTKKVDPVHYDPRGLTRDPTRGPVCHPTTKPGNMIRTTYNKKDVTCENCKRNKLYKYMKGK